MATSARTQQLLNQRKQFATYNRFSSGRISLLSGTGSLAERTASIAKKTIETELSNKIKQYNDGLISNTDMKDYLTKIKGNTSLSASDKVDIEDKIRDFDEKVKVEKLEAVYKNAGDNTQAKIDAAQALANHYTSRAKTLQTDTPVYSTALQKAGQWSQTAIKEKDQIEKIARSLKRAQLFKKVAGETESGSIDEAQKKAQSYQAIADQARVDGDETQALQLETYAQRELNRIPGIELQQSKKIEAENKKVQAENKKIVTDYINTTYNDYKDGKISPVQAIANLNYADEQASTIGDTSLQLRLNNLSQAVSKDVEQGVSYQRTGAFGAKNKPAEIILNADGTVGYKYSSPGLSQVGSTTPSPLGTKFTSTIEKAINSVADKYLPGDAEFKKVVRAIVTAESGGNPNIEGDGGASIGLLQANMAQGRGVGYTKEQLKDPYFNLELGMAELVPAYQQGIAQGIRGSQLAAYVSRVAQRPAAGYEQNAAAAYEGSSPRVVLAGAQSPKATPTGPIDYQNEIKKVHKWFVDGVDADGEPFNADRYMALLGAFSESRKQELEVAISNLGNLDPDSKITYQGKKTQVSTLRDKLQKELDNVTVEVNQISNGDVIPVMSLKKSGSVTKPIVELKPKSEIADFDLNYVLDDQGIAHKIINPRQYFASQQEADAYLAQNPTAKIQTDKKTGKIYTSGDNLVDIHDTQGNRVRYKVDENGGFSPVIEGNEPEDVSKRLNKLNEAITRDAEIAQALGEGKKLNKPLSPKSLQRYVDTGEADKLINQPYYLKEARPLTGEIAPGSPQKYGFTKINDTTFVPIITKAMGEGKQSVPQMSKELAPPAPAIDYTAPDRVTNEPIKIEPGVITPEAVKQTGIRVDTSNTRIETPQTAPSSQPAASQPSSQPAPSQPRLQVANPPPSPVQKVAAQLPKITVPGPNDKVNPNFRSQPIVVTPSGIKFTPPPPPKPNIVQQVVQKTQQVAQQGGLVQKAINFASRIWPFRR